MNHKRDIEGLVFPCEIDIKVFVRSQDGLEEMIRNLILDSISESDLIGITAKISVKGNYQSLSCKVRADNKPLMDTLFARLSSHPDVLMVI